MPGFMNVTQIIRDVVELDSYPFTTNASFFDRISLPVSNEMLYWDITWYTCIRTRVVIRCKNLARCNTSRHSGESSNYNLLS